MTYLDQGLTGAKRQSNYENNAATLLTKLVKQYHGRRTKEEILEMFFEQYRRSRLRYEDSVLVYYGENNYRRIVKSRLTSATRKTTEEGVRAAQLLLANKTLMNLPMPNGKSLGECTGAECRSIGSWASALADKVKPNQRVCDALREQDLRSAIEKSVRR